MFGRAVRFGVLAVMTLAFAYSPLHAFGRRSAACYPVHCCPVVWCPCPLDPCPIPYPPCPPAPTCCCVFAVTGTPVPVTGPFPAILLVAQVGSGVIVQVDIPSGTNPAPTDLIQVTQSGAGEMRYEGWNKKEVTPGKPGGAIRYSIFLCPIKAGDATVNVGFAYSDNTMKSVPFAFTIR